MQLVAVGASNIQIRKNGNVQSNLGVQFWVETMRRIALIVCYTVFIHLLTAYTAYTYTNELPNTFNRHARHVQPNFVYTGYFLHRR